MPVLHRGWKHFWKSKEKALIIHEEVCGEEPSSTWVTESSANSQQFVEQKPNYNYNILNLSLKFEKCLPTILKYRVFCFLLN